EMLLAVATNDTVPLVHVEPFALTAWARIFAPAWMSIVGESNSTLYALPVDTFELLRRRVSITACGASVIESTSSVPFCPFGAPRLTLKPEATLNVPKELSSTTPALPTAELASKDAPDFTVRSLPARRMMLPALPRLLAALSFAVEAIRMALPAVMTMSPPVLVRLRATRRLDTLARLLATIWIEPLRTTMPLALCSPRELTVEANLMA